MANEVYANGREIACKAGAGKTIAAFPDVCFTPPENPATPPGVPVPYPNTGLASDTTEGSKTVMISDKEIMLKNNSYFKTSSGDEAGCAAKKGVITSKNTGKVYFNAWSMDVKFEGENVDRHLDLTTNNHASMPGDTPPWPFTDSMSLLGVDCAKILLKIGIVIHRYKDAEKHCEKGKQQSDHIVQNACFENSRGMGGISTASRYKLGNAPCVCLQDGTDRTTEHGRKTAAQNETARNWRERKKNPTYGEARDENIKAMKKAKPELENNEKAVECIKLALKEYFEDDLGLKENDSVRTPHGGAFKLPSGGQGITV